MDPTWLSTLALAHGQKHPIPPWSLEASECLPASLRHLDGLGIESGECLRPRSVPFVAQLEGDELGSGRGESAQQNLRNHKSNNCQFPR
jgi:hypothetical protein